MNARWPREGGPVFASHFATWDTAHYLYLSEVGYAKDVPSCAFYPLWPLMIRVLSVFIGGSHLIAGMILANVFSLAGWVLFYQLTARWFGERIAVWSLVFLILFPGSIFYQFIYSEPLLFLLLMVLWWGLGAGTVRGGVGGSGAAAVDTRGWRFLCAANRLALAGPPAMAMVGPMAMARRGKRPVARSLRNFRRTPIRSNSSARSSRRKEAQISFWRSR